MATTAPTQVKYPWRTVARSVFQGLVAFAALLPLILSVAGVPAVGWVAAVVTVAGAITRVMATPAVETFLETYVPFLAAKPKVTTETERSLSNG